MTLAPAVAVFLEPPRLGLVKPRLAADVGPHHALRLYRVLTARTLAAVRDLGIPAVVWFTPADAQPEMRHWLGSEWELRPQAAGALGARLALAARGVEPGRPWMVVLSETIGLAPARLAEARDALLDVPAVLVATSDGGCALIGARAPLAGLAAGLTGDGRITAPVIRSALDRLAAGWRELDSVSAIETGADAKAAGLLT